MAKGKNGFVLYADMQEYFNELSDEDAGKLIKHVFSYVNDENPEAENAFIKLAFIPIKQQLKRDLKKYESVCSRNKVNGQKGGRPKNTDNEEDNKNPKEPKKPSGLFGNPQEPKKPDNDNDNDNDNDTDKEIKQKTDTFIIFWNYYHKITGRKKEDKEPALKYWNKIKIEEQRKAYNNVEKWYNSLSDKMKNDKQFIKKCRTYLSDKNYNDELEEVKSNILPKYNPNNMRK